MRLLALLLLVVCGATAQDLNALRETQRKLLQARDESKPPKDEVPLDVIRLAKQQLLALAETRLWAAADGGDLAALAFELDSPIKDQDTLDRLGELEFDFEQIEGAYTPL